MEAIWMLCVLAYFAIALQCVMVLMLPLLFRLVFYVLAVPNFCTHVLVVVENDHY
jgi:hypothetical protein